MTKAELKTAPLSLRVKPSLKAAIEQLAADDRRSIAEFVEIVLEDYVDARGKSEPAKKLRRS